MIRIPLSAVLLTFLCPLFVRAEDLAEHLKKLDATVIPADEAKEKQLSQMISMDARNRIRAANQRETAAWNKVKTRADWEKMRDVRIQALRDSLAIYPEVPKDLKVRVTRKMDGDGFQIENVVYESRPGLLVTANLYLPAKPPKSMPGVIVIHSHHNPKTQSELQDMGMTWARQGCMVLVPDQLGHGERRAHPFVDAKSFPDKFAPSRQDYYFRYNTAMQLHLVGDSLVGWMAWDMMRGLDLLLRRGVDKDMVILLGSVAGGGDPCAVTGAVDPRITVVGPFNFGGPQPETTFPLPPDAAKVFNYAGGGSWESTRNLRLSARDGFQPWVIVGSVAPRRLIYGHEFAWDQENDPVWARLQTIFGFYDKTNHLTAAIGKGKLSGKPPESSHCNNIGAIHRIPIHAALKRWFGIEVPNPEYQERRPAADLLCLTDDIKPQPLHALARDLGAERAEAARRRLAEMTPDARKEQLRKDWDRLLGGVEPPREAKGMVVREKRQVGDVTVYRLVQEVEPNIVVPMVLLIPPRKGNTGIPIVIGIAQDGKKGFLTHRTETIAALLQGGAAVCLPDLRGTGETRPGDSRGRTSSSTSISSSELMLGRTLLGLRLRDLRSIVKYFTEHTALDGSHVALWGDSFAPVNPPDRRLEVPWDAEKLPDQSEPLGSLLALLGALYEDNVRTVYGHGGLSGYHSVLESSFCYVPHDAIVPGALTAGDLGDISAALAPRSQRWEGFVDGRNRRVDADHMARAFAAALKTYRAGELDKRFNLAEKPSSSQEVARFLLAGLKVQ